MCDQMNESECEYEHVRQVAKLLEVWSDRPTARVADHPWSLTCVNNMVVPPGTTTKVSVYWPVLSTDEFEEFSELNLLWEFCGNGSHEKDESCVQLVGGIAPLRVGQQANLCCFTT